MMLDEGAEEYERAKQGSYGSHAKGQRRRRKKS